MEVERRSTCFNHTVVPPVNSLHETTPHQDFGSSIKGTEIYTRTHTAGICGMLVTWQVYAASLHALDSEISLL